MARGRRRSAAAGAVMDVLMRAPPLPLPLTASAIERLFGVRRYAARLQAKRTEVRGLELPYLEGGEGEPLVLLHGFADNKDAFVDVARLLTSGRRVILPDLVGFGEASRPRDFAYRLATMAEVVGDLLEALGVDRYDLGGNSLGGAIALQLALDRPQSVRSLALLNSAGIEMPRPSLVQQRLDAGDNPWVIAEPAEYEAWLSVVMESPPSIPPAVQKYLAREFLSRAELNRKIMDDLLEGDQELTRRLPGVRPPTLVVWGGSDRVIDISVGQVMHDKIPDARFVILHGVGHCPHYEAPKQTAGLLRDFLRDVDLRERNVSGPSDVTSKSPAGR